jgi:diguanylate cyclase (GGDEF)-like protein
MRGDVPIGAGMVFWRRCYLAVLILLHVLHPMLAAPGRSVVYLLNGMLAVPPLVALVRRAPCAPWWLLLAAMVVLSVGNTFNAAGGAALLPVVQILITVGHATLLCAAIALVLRRGRNDIGGMLDVAVAAVAVGGLVWTALLFPRLVAMHSDSGAQLTILVGILALAGVLGALLRLWCAGGRQPALGLLLLALTAALAGNIVLARISGQLTTTGTRTVDMGFMLAYGLVGLAALHPSATTLFRPSAAPADRLTTGRLLFLGLALLANPVAGGVREMLGQDPDGPLLTAGSIVVTTLVLIRVGRLARQHQHAELRLRHQATHDLLTGLPNRAELLTRLAAALDRERAAGSPAVVLLFCDLNGFKQVNDRLGHEAGDQLLTGVAQRIGAGLRAGDTLARYGGDEFLLLCEDDVPQAAAIRLTGHVERALAEPFRLAGELVPIGASVGAVISGGDEDADELISRADQAMYRAKQAHQAAQPDGGLRSARR